jgi:hypothetical protein
MTDPTTIVCPHCGALNRVGARDSNAIVGWVQQHLVAAGHEGRVS